MIPLRVGGHVAFHAFNLEIDREPHRIDSVQRIAGHVHVAVAQGGQVAPDPDRVAADEASQRGVHVPCAIVVEVGLRIEPPPRVEVRIRHHAGSAAGNHVVAAGKGAAEINAAIGARLVDGRAAVGIVKVAFDDRAGGVGKSISRPLCVLVEVKLLVAGADRGAVAVKITAQLQHFVKIDPKDILLREQVQAVPFLDHAIAVVIETRHAIQGTAASDRLADPASDRVVVVLGHGEPVRFPHRAAQAVEVVPAVFHLAVVGQVAVVVVAQAGRSPGGVNTGDDFVEAGVVARLAVNRVPIARAVEREAGVLRRDRGCVGTDKTGKSIGGIVSVLLVIHRVVQLVLGELVVHAIVGVRKANNQRVVGAEVANLDSAAESIVADVSGACVVQIRHPCPVLRIRPNQDAIGTNVVVVSNGQSSAGIRNRLQTIQVVVGEIERASIAVGEAASEVFGPPGGRSHHAGHGRRPDRLRVFQHAAEAVEGVGHGRFGGRVERIVVVSRPDHSPESVVLEVLLVGADDGGETAAGIRRIGDWAGREYGISTV